jgi:hypothetical protein
LEDLLPESGFCWKRTVKTPYFGRSRKIQKKSRKLYFPRRLRKPEGGVERSQRAASHIGGAAWPLAAPALCEGTLAHSRSRPFAYFIVPENLSQGGGSEKDTAASAGWKTPEKEKLSGSLVKFLEETFPVLITLVVDAIEWNR